MTEQIVRSQARCEDCNKAYRVPDPNRTYKCKACGGTVRPIDDFDDAEDEDEPRVETAASRHEATVALKNAFGWLSGLTWFYGLGSVANLVAALFAILALARTEVPVGGGVLVVALATIVSAAMLMGAIKLHFQPLKWAIAVACVATVATIAQLAGPEPFGLAFIVSAVSAALAWAAVIPIRHLRELIDEHEDLYILHHASVRTRRSLKSHEGEHDQHERLLGVMEGASARAWKFAAMGAVAVGALSAAGTYAVLAAVRPQPLSDSVATFEAAWNGADVDAIGGLFDAQVRERETARLAGLLEGHGWQAAMPQLSDGETREVDEITLVDYELDDVTISAHWVLDGQEWIMARVELPDPPFDPSFERFLEAWRNSDAQGLVAFISSEHRDKMLDYLENGARRRDWETYPKITGTEIGDYIKDERIAILDLAGEKVTTKWHLGADGRWGLHGLSLPTEKEKE